MLLQGKTVFISGAGPGLGRQVAIATLREGGRVILAARDQKRVNELQDEIDPDRIKTRAVIMDLNSDDSIRQACTEAQGHFGTVDALVQVAAAHVFGLNSAISPEDWMSVYRTNVVGVMQLVKGLSEGMRARSDGAIIFIGSQALLKPTIEEIGYAASKAALASSMYYLAKELGPDGIRVNSVIPSWMMGPALESFLQARAIDEGVGIDSLIEELASGNQLKRLVSDADVAEVVVFFASDRAKMITGQSLLVNAGEYMR